MMPQNVLSATPELGTLLAPRNQRLASQLLTDYELGGIALNDASQGLEVQTWTCVCDGHNFVITSPSDPGGTTILTVAGNVVDMSFTFDQNMKQFVAYTLDDGTSWFYWFDALGSAFATTQLPTGSVSPRCTLDDKRPQNTSSSDIILAYVNLTNQSMYFRQQRDRYLIEYDLTDYGNSVSTLINIGLSTVNRMQFILTPP